MTEEQPGADLPPDLWEQYLKTALWSSLYSAPEDAEDAEEADPRGLEDGDAFDNEYGPGDIDEKTLIALAANVRKFLAMPGVEEAIEVAVDKYGRDDENIGHHLWLTHGRHGAGFWDGDYGDAKDPTSPAAILTAAAHQLPEETYFYSYQPEGTEESDEALLGAD